jgi:tetratricopeptide (TPR) repeat protein
MSAKHVVSRGLLGVLAAFAVSATGCSRNAIEAVNLANEGDKAREVNIEDAISKYDQANKLDPDNHRIAWKLALAYHKKEDWPKVASTCAKAEEASEKAAKKKAFANYYFEHGYALTQVAMQADKEKGGSGSSSWADAKQPLQTAIAADANYAEAYETLGDVLLHTDDEQGALENYTKAIQTKPDELMYYPPLADLYVRLNYMDQAEQVVREGLTYAKEGDKHLFTMHALLGQVLEAKNNIPGAITEYEAAKKACGQCSDHKEAYFLLGAAYAEASPPRKNEAMQQFQSFNKIACKGASAPKFSEQCAQASEIARKLGGTLQ